MFAPLLLAVLLAGPDGPPNEVLAEVAGESITRGRVHLLLTLRGVPEEKRAAAWDEATATLADRARMRRFLATRRAVPDEAELDAQTAALLVEHFGEDKAAQTAALAKLGATPADVRAEAALPLAWEEQAQRLITPAALREYFEANRRRYDDTALTVAHIFQPGDATEALARVKARIDAGELTFAEAAKQFSKSPTASKGGVIGALRAGDGKAPPEVSAAAFALPPDGSEDGTVLGPVRSAVGTHLVSVLGVAEPGELSLTDVRSRVRRDLKRRLWFEQIERLR
ncbi:peptidylprolyl isomerase [Alienimonas chondri]|uniref:Foldase protein PrsA n=1 Tax=Alienimonas chondri TaxID=2681879 RepID=A0ABX1VIG1_9PLAN|nr:peptidylprolyl isomerase [Alienimonas chondri]NNJ27898.1 Foldase protein PrsA [Alienimonas chondri]